MGIPERAEKGRVLTAMSDEESCKHDARGEKWREEHPVEEDEIVKLRCKECGEEYPATREFFRKTAGGRKGWGLSYRCRPCDTQYHAILKKERASGKGRGAKSGNENNGGYREEAGGKKKGNGSPKLSPCLKCGKAQVDRSVMWLCYECKRQNSKLYGVMAEGH